MRGEDEAIVEDSFDKIQEHDNEEEEVSYFHQYNFYIDLK